MFGDSLMTREKLLLVLDGEEGGESVDLLGVVWSSPAVLAVFKEIKEIIKCMKTYLWNNIRK